VDLSEINSILDSFRTVFAQWLSNKHSLFLNLFSETGKTDKNNKK